MWEQYFSPTSLNQALTLLAQHKDHARIIAGGTDLIIEMDRKQRPNLQSLIDISRISGLDKIQYKDGYIEMGPLVTHNQAVADPLIRQYALPLAQACWEVGAPQIRNRATIAGNLITASPANDTITPLWALDATVSLQSQAGGERSLSFDEFYQGLRHTAMRPDEMLTKIRFRAMDTEQRGIFIKLGLRQAQAISVVNIAVLLRFEGATVSDAVFTYGSVAPTILKADALSDAIRGKSLDDETIRHIAKLASTIPTPIDDVRAPATYRTEMVKVLTARALRQLAAGTEAEHFPENPAMLWGKNQVASPETAFEINASSPIQTRINGVDRNIEGGQNKTLLDFLREDCGLTGTKEGCAEGECGACTVFLDGMAVMACMVPAPRAHHAEIVTIEGLAKGDALHPLQQTFVDTGAVQCGFCTPGFIMAGAKLLEEHPRPNDAQIAQSISGNLCRCTGYYKIVEAFHKASEILKEG